MYERDLESVDRIMDIREMIKNGGNLSVLSNVFLKDYQIKLIPHLDTDDKDENEKAALLTDEQALDTLYKGHQTSNEYQKAVDAYLIRHIDEDFLERFGDEDKIGDYKAPYNNGATNLMETHGDGLANFRQKTLNNRNNGPGSNGNSRFNTDNEGPRKRGDRSPNNKF